MIRKNKKTKRNINLYIYDIEKDSFGNLKQYFSLEIKNFKSRYKDISKFFGEYDINFYSTSDLINLENLPNYFDSINTENIIDSLKEIGKIYLSTKSDKNAINTCDLQKIENGKEQKKKPSKMQR